ncbi:MAG: type II toxin-antitoxin system RelE/ParE family toxin [Erysipelotrichaceae bacterium]|nr:type II toxin-antitoxin system RelE/ParE family toxin [Erysipelotrichaceae bacterium]
MYRVSFIESALKSIKKLDKYTQRIILEWVEKNLEGCSDPRIQGRLLTANKKGQWRYRVGDYRIIAEIQDQKIIILFITIGHRKDVYMK